MHNKSLIIAEAGVNHNGDIQRAIQLVEAAAMAGADIVKFQTFKTELNIAKGAKKAHYQITSTGNDESQFEMVKKLELSFEQFLMIKNKCDEVGIQFLSTGFDIPSINFLCELEPPFLKIPSGEITNKPFLQYLASKGLPIILSTGMATIDEIRSALKVIEEEGLGRENITVLHCNSEYPTPMRDVNLHAMNHIKSVLNVAIGYSDHTLGIEVPIAAVALGATVIEKHFTLDRTLPGPDHAASLEPNELKAMVSAIRNIELALSGSGIKEPSESEKKNILIGRKSIHYRVSKVKNQILSNEDLVMLRPGNGISPMDLDKYIGKSLMRDVSEFSLLQIEDFK